MGNLIFSLNATIPVFLLMVLGYILKVCGLVDAPFVKTLNAFNFKITLPVLLFRDIATSDFAAVWDTRYVLFCFLVTLFCIVVIWGGSALFYKNKACNSCRPLIAAVPQYWALPLLKIFTETPVWRRL